MDPGTGAAVGGGAGAVGGLLGIGAQHYSAQALGQESVKNTRFLRKRQFQDAKLSMERAGINPILAARAGLGGTGAGAHMPGGASGNVGGAVAAGASAGAAASQASTARTLAKEQANTERVKQAVGQAEILVKNADAMTRYAQYPTVVAQNARDVQKLKGLGGALTGGMYDIIPGGIQGIMDLWRMSGLEGPTARGAATIKKFWDEQKGKGYMEGIEDYGESKRSKY